MRMHFGADDEAYLCMGNGQDDFGNRGIYLRKTIIGVTTKAMTEALNALAPHVLPLSELVRPISTHIYVFIRIWGGGLRNITSSSARERKRDAGWHT